MSGEANKARKKYAVVYQDDQRKVSFTMLVIARTMAHSTRLARNFIQSQNLHPHDHPYFLTPALAPPTLVPTYTVE